MSGYTVTLTDSEYDALKARIARLEAALEQAMEWNWMQDGVPEEVIKQCHEALGSPLETKGDGRGDI
jgi:hypothetical protein